MISRKFRTARFPSFIGQCRARFSQSLLPWSGVLADPLIKPVEETQDVHVLDRLLSDIREQSEPVLRSAMPMRSPVLWRDNLSMPARIPVPLRPSPVTSLQPRRMHDSYTQVVMPFASSPELLDQYTNASGGIRTGKIMEHLDSLAGSIAYKHVLGPSVDTLGNITEAGLYIVTASIDRLDMLFPLAPEHIDDIRLSGQVIYVGNSSMEIVVKMEGIKPGTGEEQTMMIGRFSMVCRDAFTNKARRVNPLVLETESEKRLFALGEAHKERKKAQSSRSLLRVPPSESESALIHALFLKHQIPASSVSTKDRPVQSVRISDTKLESTTLMHPQERNVHQKVFGGYLMRLAYELGYTSATLFTRQPLQFISLDSTTFKLPVPVGSILRLTSKIVHTMSDEDFSSLVNVRVQANVVDVQSAEERNTNEFHFTWGRNDGEPPSRTVIPVTYPEAMHWLEGRRALELGAQIRGLRR